MSKIIEIIDSDDDGMPPMVKDVCADPKTDENVNGNTDDHQDSQEDLLVQSSSNSTEPQLKRNRNRRKSMHQPMRSSPDIHFETIALDDDNDKDVNISKDQDRLIMLKSKSFKPPPPKILVPKPPTTDELLSTANNDFLNANETLLRQIAEERIRINYLLASYSLPDINFSLYTQIERLKFQLTDRIKQRQLINAEAARRRLQKPMNVPS